MGKSNHLFPKNTYFCPKNRQKRMEELLHYVWKHKMFPLTALTTIDGRPLEVLHPGLPNRDAGPDFFNAKIIIDGTTWVGNVEMHVKASDWFLHHHDEDERYDSIVLHVVEESDATLHRRDGQLIPQLVLPIPEAVRQRYAELLAADHYPPCYQTAGSLGKLMMHSWMSALLVERLEMRCEQIGARYREHELNWNDALFATLARNFGFGVNGDAFEVWARSMPFRAVDKHRDHLMQVEALFFGQAGLLTPSALPVHLRDEATTDPYFTQLSREYAFLAHKFSLKPISSTLWKFARMRPDNSPFVRMAQLAMLYHKGDFCASRLIEVSGRDELRDLLTAGTSPYWDTHFTFGGTPTPARPKQLGESSFQLVIINTLAPYLFVYGRRHNNEAICERAFSLLEQLPSENNYIIRGWRDCGIAVTSAADSQALIHLKRNYCERKECLRCRIGYECLRRSLQPDPAQ